MLPDLERITVLAELLGDPQQAYPSVHVTGTNGKGSVVRMTAALLAASGLSAGTYTSPHLQSIRERLSVAGRHVSERRFAALYADVAPLADLVDDGRPDEEHVTFFELLTAMAYWWFADAPVDVGVFEVGMGGTWDATNLVRGDVAVINGIDVDHRELGTSPEEAAHEKAGIVKPGTRVVSARQAPEVLRVVQDAVREAGATLWVAGDDVDVVSRSVAVGGQLVGLRVGDRVVPDILLPLFGAHQADNAALALGAFAAFLGDAFAQVDDELIRQGLAAVHVPGRLEIVHRDPTVVLDGAHNPDGARACAAAIEEAFGFRNLVLVTASLADKDITGILRALAPVANHVIVTRAPGERGAPVDRMATLAQEVWAGTGVAVEGADSVTQALEKATGLTAEGDGILVTGSLYTVGAARDVYLPPLDLGDHVRGDDVVYEPGAEDEADPLAVGDEEAFDEALERMLDELDRPDDPD